MTTLSTLWQRHIETLPIDITPAELRRQEREWYRARLTELEAAPRTRENTDLLVEAANWARLYIGRAA